MPACAPRFGAGTTLGRFQLPDLEFSAGDRHGLAVRSKDARPGPASGWIVISQLQKTHTRVNSPYRNLAGVEIGRCQAFAVRAECQALPGPGEIIDPADFPPGFCAPESDGSILAG